MPETNKKAGVWPAFLFVSGENGLEDRQTCISVEEVNLVSVNVQFDVLADMRLGTWINAGYHLFSLGDHVQQQFAAQVLNDFNGRAHT